MRSIVAAVLAASVGLCLPAAAEARCRVPEDANVVAKQRSAVVYMVETEDEFIGYACPAATGRPVIVAQSHWMEGPHRLSRLRFAGRWLAFVDSYAVGHYGDGGIKVTVVDLLGRHPRGEQYLMSFTMGDDRPRLLVTSLALNRHGGVVWRFTGYVAASGELVESHDGIGVFDGRGGRTLATAPAGTITGLRLAGRRATWTAQGVAGRAVLHGHARQPL